MDGQQQFLKPVQHVPFYVKRPITIDASSHPQLFAYANGGNKPASYSVDLSHPRFGRPKQTDQLSEPINRAQSKSLRDVFEKAILRGDVAIYSPDEDSGVMRNPSFITASLPRPDKHKQKSATIGGDNYMHIGKSGYRKRNDYFVDSSSDSDSDSGRGGQHNDAYIDDASSTVSDEMFKSTSEGPAHSNEEEEFQVQPLPHLLDVEVGHQAGRSTLGGFFKPKYRDYPRNNVHRSSEREHKETIDSGTSRNFRNLHRNSISLNKGDNSVHRNGSMLTHRQEPSSDSGRLPRTKLLLGERTQTDLVPNIGTDWDSIAIETQGSSRQGRIERRDSGGGAHSPRMSHNKYLPKKRRNSRPRSPRLTNQDTAFNDLDSIEVLSPEIQRRQSQPLTVPQHQRQGRLTAEGTPLEQMELEDPPWMKAEIRERRRRRNKKICVAVVILSLLVVVAGLAVLLSQVLVPKAEVSSTSLQPVSVIQTTTPVLSTTTASTLETQNLTLTFDGSMRVLNKEFEVALQNLSSPQSITLANDFCGTMKNVFTLNASNNAFTYDNCSVTKFKAGSIVIYFNLNIIAKVKRESTSNSVGIGAVDKVDQARKVDQIKQYTNEEWAKLNPGGENWVVDNVRLELNTTESDNEQHIDKSLNVTELPTSKKLKLTVTPEPTTNPTTTTVSSTTTRMPTTTTRAPSTTTSTKATVSSTTIVATTRISTTTTTFITTPTKLQTTTTVSPATTTALPTTTTTSPTTTPTTTATTTTALPATTTALPTTTTALPTRPLSRIASTAVPDSDSVASEEASTEGVIPFTSSRATASTSVATPKPVTQSLTTSSNGSSECFIHFLTENCNTAYYQCGTINGHIQCRKGMALTLELTPFPWNNSACTIPINISADSSAALNDSCPIDRQFLRYDCPSLLQISILPMNDLDYIPDCCPVDYIFDKNSNTCEECINCSSAESEDDTT